MKRRNFIKLIGVGVAIPLLPPLNFASGGGANNSMSGLIKTGILGLDQKIRGFMPGELVIIGGRPSMGKTQIALQIARNAALRNNQCVAYFSVESSKKNIMQIILSAETGIKLNKIKHGRIAAGEWLPLTKATGNISTSKLFIDDRAGITSRDIQQVLNNFSSKEKVNLVIVDYLQLMDTSMNYKTREEAIRKTLTDLKHIAVQNKTVVVVMVRLNMPPMNRVLRPKLEDFGAIGPLLTGSTADLSVVDKAILLFRENYYNSEVGHNLMEYHIAMNNKGSTGLVISS